MHPFKDEIARRALCIYVALTVPLGALVHVIGESAALGRNPVALAVAPLHRYLAVLSLLAMAAVCVVIARVPRDDRRRQFALLVRSLPFDGTGARFTAFGTGLQIAFYVITECAERSPFGLGDVWIGLAAALLAALFGAFVIQAARAGIARIVTALRELFAPLQSAHAMWQAAEFTPGLPYFAYLPCRGSRPPPFAPNR